MQPYAYADDNPITPLGFYYSAKRDYCDQGYGYGWRTFLFILGALVVIAAVAGTTAHGVLRAALAIIMLFLAMLAVLTLVIGLRARK
jgi:hypothetical protein